jgi:aspartate aminotransferase
MADTRAIDPDENVAGARLLAEARVAVVPGTDFEAPGLVRMSYACATPLVVEAVRRITAMVS